MPISLRSSTSLFPWLRYAPQGDSWWVADGAGGKRKIVVVGRKLAFDPEAGQQGWLMVSESARNWVPYGEDGEAVPRPSPLHKKGFGMFVAGAKTLGRDEIHEACSNTVAWTDFSERLYNECEPRFGNSEIPIVTITGAKPVKIGMGMSSELQFKVDHWIKRPQAFIDAAKKRDGGFDTHGAQPDPDDDDDDDFGEATAKPGPKAEPEPAAKKSYASAIDDDDDEADDEFVAPKAGPKPATKRTRKSNTKDQAKATAAKAAAGLKPEPGSLEDLLDDEIPDFDTKPEAAE